MEQTSACAGCGQVITEIERCPCDRCGSINRHISVSAEDTLAATDAA